MYVNIFSPTEDKHEGVCFPVKINFPLRRYYYFFVFSLPFRLNNKTRAEKMKISIISHSGKREARERERKPLQHLRSASLTNSDFTPELLLLHFLNPPENFTFCRERNKRRKNDLLLPLPPFPLSLSSCAKFVSNPGAGA